MWISLNPASVQCGIFKDRFSVWNKEIYSLRKMCRVFLWMSDVSLCARSAPLCPVSSLEWVRDTGQSAFIMLDLIRLLQKLYSGGARWQEREGRGLESKEKTNVWSLQDVIHIPLSPKQPEDVMLVTDPPPHFPVSHSHTHAEVGNPVYLSVWWVTLYISWSTLTIQK